VPESNLLAQWLRKNAPRRDTHMLLRWVLARQARVRKRKEKAALYEMEARAPSSHEGIR
jgi:hypothetical protein